MFKSFHGFHLVEALHLEKASQMFKQSHYIKFAICSVLSIIIACLPTEVFGIPGLTPIEQRVIVVAVLLCFGLSNFISNSATAALLVPVLGVAWLVLVF